MNSLDKRWYWLLFSLIGFIVFLGLFFPLIDPDANEYAAIAMRMVQRNDFVNIISRSHITLQEFDYLDKPHLLFWLSALSYKIFGISDWAYRLPSILFSALGVYSTYRLGSLLYNKEVGKNAALFFASSLAIILFNHDVRTDTLLTSFVIFGMWQLAEFVEKEKLRNIILGAAGVALGVASKGMISVLVCGTSIFCHIAYLRKWKLLYNWKWLIGLLAFFITLSPVLYCYYLQFDLHPEKFVNGSYGQSGIKYILWTQSFERLSGGRATSSPEFSFFYHTMLWAILPWSILVYASVFGRIKRFWEIGLRSTKEIEMLTLGGILIIFHLMSASKFKLPHYLNILFPLFAILLASYLYNLQQKRKLKILQKLIWVQYFIVGVLVLLTIVLNIWVFPVSNFWVLVGGVIFSGLLAYSFLKWRDSLARIIVPSVLAILLLSFFLNTNFYPRLLQYQLGNTVATLAKKEGIPPNKTFIYKRLAYSLDFYLQQTTPALTDSSIFQKNRTGVNFYLVVFDEHLEAVKSMNLNVTKTFTIPQFRVSRLDGKFLNPATRGAAFQNVLLLQINSKAAPSLSGPG